MHVKAKKRLDKTKSAIKQIRREGNIPAVFYAPGKENVSLVVDGREFLTVLRKIKQGLLPTTVFNLDIEGKKTRAIVKDIQYDLTSYKTTHLDFEELDDKVPVQVNVPVFCTGVADCVGVKLGGFLRQVIRTIKVECLPKNIPQQFVVEVQELGIRGAKRLSDIKMPNGVKPLASTDEVVVVIAKGKV